MRCGLQIGLLFATALSVFATDRHDGSPTPPLLDSTSADETPTPRYNNLFDGDDIQYPVTSAVASIRQCVNLHSESGVKSSSRRPDHIAVASKSRKPIILPPLGGSASFSNGQARPETPDLPGKPKRPEYPLGLHETKTPPSQSHGLATHRFSSATSSQVDTQRGSRSTDPISIVNTTTSTVDQFILVSNCHQRSFISGLSPSDYHNETISLGISIRQAAKKCTEMALAGSKPYPARLEWNSFQLTHRARADYTCTLLRYVPCTTSCSKLPVDLSATDTYLYKSEMRMSLEEPGETSCGCACSIQ